MPTVKGRPAVAASRSLMEELRQGRVASPWLAVRPGAMMRIPHDFRNSGRAVHRPAIKKRCAVPPSHAWLRRPGQPDPPSPESAWDVRRSGYSSWGRLAMRIRNSVSQLDDRGSRSVRVRLIEFLLARSTSPEPSTICIEMTQAQLAETLGTVREVVCREMRRLAHAKLIASLGAGRYQILDAGGLRQARDDSSAA